MASVLITTADAVLAELNAPTGHTWSKSFVAERNFGDWKLPLESAEDAVKVDVFPAVAIPCESRDRASLDYSPTIAIVVRYKFRQADSEADTGRPIEEVVEELNALVEEINEHFADPRVSIAANTHWISSEVVPWVVEHLSNPRQFTGMARPTYRVTKDF